MATLNEEIGKLIADRLLAGIPLFLPEEGSLQVKRQAARKVARNLVAPPLRRVEFHPDSKGESLVAEIATVAHCSEEQAAEVYARWHTKAKDAQGLVIEGVGTIRNGRFLPDPHFEKALNPRGSKPIKVHRPMPWWIWSLLTLLIVFLVMGGLSLLVDPWALWTKYSSRRATQEVIVPVEEPSSQPEIPTAVVEPTDSLAVPQEEVDTVAVEPVSKPSEPIPMSESSAEEIVRTRSGMSYIVLGIFSTETNARRAISQAEEQYGIEAQRCRIFRYADKYLVSLGELPTRAEAQELAAKYRVEKQIRDLWVYSKQ